MSLGTLTLIALALALGLIAVFMFGRRSGRKSVQPVVLPPVVLEFTTTITRSETSERPTPPHPRASKKLSAREKAFVDEAMKRARVDLGSNMAPALDVVGESYHQEELRKIAGDRLANGETVVFTALIVPEPANPYDPNSIMVIADGIGPIGHLPREHAVEYGGVAKYLLSREAVGVCEGWLTGGIPERAPTIGAMLCIDDAPALEMRLRDMLPLG